VQRMVRSGVCERALTGAEPRRLGSRVNGPSVGFVQYRQWFNWNAIRLALRQVAGVFVEIWPKKSNFVEIWPKESSFVEIWPKK